MDTRTLNKLKKAAPLMMKYAENEKKIKQTEQDYVSRACHDLPGRNVVLPKKPDGKAHKIISYVYNAAFPFSFLFIVIGFIRLATTSGDFGGMGAAFGIFLAIGSYFYAKHESKAFNEEMSKYEAAREQVDNYNAAREAAAQEYRDSVEIAKQENETLIEEITALKVSIPVDLYGGADLILSYIESGYAASLSEACDQYRDNLREWAEDNRRANEMYWFRFHKCNTCKRHLNCKTENSDNVTSCTSYKRHPKFENI